MQRELRAFRQTAALCIGQGRGIKLRAIRPETDLLQTGRHHGILWFGRCVAQGIGKFGKEDQILRYPRRVEGHARLGKRKVGGKLGL